MCEFCYGQYATPRARGRVPVVMVTRARARAQRSARFCFEKVAMLSWKVESSLSGNRMDVELKMGYVVFSLLWAIENAPRARGRAPVTRTAQARARVERSVVF